MSEYKDPMKKNVVRLNHDQKYKVYMYAIENRCVYQNEVETTFRVAPSHIANELNMLKHIGEVINANHVKEAIEMTISWQKRLNKLPMVPKETLEIEKLKEDNLKTVKQVEELKLLLAQARELNKTEGLASSKLARIKAILAV